MILIKYKRIKCTLSVSICSYSKGDNFLKPIIYNGSTIIIKFGQHRKCFRTYHCWTFQGKYGLLLGTSPGFVRTASPPPTVICTKWRFHSSFQYGDSKYLNLNDEKSLLAMFFSKIMFSHSQRNFKFWSHKSDLENFPPYNTIIYILLHN